MEEQLRNRLIELYAGKYDKALYLKTLKISEEKYPFEFQRREKDYYLPVDDEEVYTDIGKVIGMLEDLKASGYTDLVKDYHGYSDSYVAAHVRKPETDYDYLERINNVVCSELLTLCNKEEIHRRKLERIKELKEELVSLEKSINNKLKFKSYD